MKTRSFLAGLLALACLTCLPLCSRATTLVVTNLADSGPGTLRAAIAVANTNAGDTITFAINGTITLASGLLISNNVTIAGPGPTHLVLEGNGQHHSIFALYLNTNITDNLSGLTIENGVGGHGGGILNNSTLVVSNCVITHNTTLSGNTGYLGEGGGVWNNGVLTLTACTVSSNSAPNYGGGIYNLGTLTVTNCTLFGNSAGSVDGGGIYNYAGALTLKNCTLSSNSAPRWGGGIYNDGALTISNCTLSGNSAMSAGGGITDNSSGTTVNNCSFSGNSAGSYGGGFLERGIGNFTLDNCTLSGNSVTNGDGGGIYTVSGTNTLNNCTLADNSASSGGGIYQDTSGMSILTNTIVAGNTATTNSPNIYAVYYAQITAVNSLTSGNPLLAPLGNYGGPTQTMPPLAGSPAIDAGDDSVTSFLTTDQRGYPRLSGAHVDIGAVEAQYAPANNPPLLLGSTFPTGAGGNGFQLAFTNVPNADFTVLASTNLALPLADWIPIGDAAQNLPGQYQFTDPGATNDPQRFYQVVSP